MALKRVDSIKYFIIGDKKDSHKLANGTSKNNEQMFLDVFVE